MAQRLLQRPATASRSNLCTWADPTTGGNAGASGTGLYDAAHQVGVLTYDNDENLFGGVGIPPGPSGQQPGTQSSTYIFLESQRINLLDRDRLEPGCLQVRLGRPRASAARR